MRGYLCLSIDPCGSTVGNVCKETQHIEVVHVTLSGLCVVALDDEVPVPSSGASSSSVVGLALLFRVGVREQTDMASPSTTTTVNAIVGGSYPAALVVPAGDASESSAGIINRSEILRCHVFSRVVEVQWQRQRQEVFFGCLAGGWSIMSWVMAGRG